MTNHVLLVQIEKIYYFYLRRQQQRQYYKNNCIRISSVEKTQFKLKKNFF